MLTVARRCTPTTELLVVRTAHAEFVEVPSN